MKYLTLLFAIVLFGCKNTGTLELEILTKQVNALNVSPDKYKEYRLEYTSAPKGAQTVITYKLTNNSDTTYYFNLNNFNSRFEKDYIKMDRAFVGIKDNKGELVKPKGREATWGVDFVANYLGYSHYEQYDKKNFIIHPGETLYFEWFIILPFGNIIEHTNYQVVLDSKEKYYAEIELDSDGTDYQNKISRTDLKTIRDNGYTVFNGTITSKNKIPVVFNKETHADTDK
ncbi:hypothetical protein AM493_13685 [Flavobacterium akiainvivens]|uniref:Lipoprotein n=1 Tax=Flavobacterium akiainvivens TaxID=1202724 RepID=A0A0M8MC01_9FLAO|nr:hypothetical protein [Flavobacterium akiainvivens]KOS06965.1 hypothetical protein AM493_13685 [Flavobacterium akiainvivens]SFQ59911.1 hypothetical protein SAMN05444144_109143 [Flavobacterium akiainvivens]